MVRYADGMDTWANRHGACNYDKPDGELYHVRAVITTPKEFVDFNECECLRRMRNNPKFIFILHNPTRSSFQKLLLQWQNGFAATNANTVSQLTPRRVGMGSLPGTDNETQAKSQSVSLCCLLLETELDLST